MPQRSSYRAWPIVAAVFFHFAGTVLATHATGTLEVQKAFLWRPFLAPFHAVVLHFPIGFVTMACVLECYRMRRPSAELKTVTTLTLWLSLLSGIVAATLGILRATSGGYQIHQLESHRWTGLAVVGATLLALVLQRFAYRKEAARLLTTGFRLSLVATLGLLVIAGHKGGNLTHGSKYLTENAPTFVRELIEDEPAEASPAVASAGLDEKLEQVQQILEKKCFRCHGPEKQKGNYRIDQAAVALAGGDSGKAAIRPGDPLNSELVRLILLPSDDDEVMPPEGKEPLNAEETLAIIRWIQQGAPFPVAGRPAAAISGG